MLRVVLGVLVDRFRARRVGIAAQMLVIAGLLDRLGCSASTASAARCLLGVVLGLAGASFAVALPLASSWYPPEHQGKALGIAGAGNSGTVLRRAVRTWAGSRLRLAERDRPGRDPACGRARGLHRCSRRTARTRRAPKPLADYLRLLRVARRLVVHVLLQRDLRRLRRASPRR